MPYEQTGITLWAIDNVVIRNLTLRHFQQDGINLHDRCRNVLLENVTLSENGRTGISVGGTSEVSLNTVKTKSNREHSLLIEELGRVHDTDSELDTEPTVQVIEN